ncbi:MAG: sulfite exporter TauE/SafE family protein [Synechococcus sp.]
MGKSFAHQACCTALFCWMAALNSKLDITTCVPADASQISSKGIDVMDIGSIGSIAVLMSGGVVAGVVAGLLGIGGGTLVVPLLVATGVEGLQATATSNLAIFMTATSGTTRNWKTGALQLRHVLALGIPAAIAGQVGVFIASDLIPEYGLLAGFALLLLLNVYLISLKKQAISQASSSAINGALAGADSSEFRQSGSRNPNTAIARWGTGGLAGLTAGLFGVGGGVIMVPLQILLLNERIKAAIQTSLGAIVLTSLFNTLGHTARGNVIWMAGLAVGAGGLIGAQLGTRFLPKLPERSISMMFRALMLGLSAFTLYKAWQAFQSAQIAVG